MTDAKPESGSPAQVSSNLVARLRELAGCYTSDESTVAEAADEIERLQAECLAAHANASYSSRASEKIKYRPGVVEWIGILVLLGSVALAIYLQTLRHP